MHSGETVQILLFNSEEHIRIFLLYHPVLVFALIAYDLSARMLTRILLGIPEADCWYLHINTKQIYVYNTYKIYVHKCTNIHGPDSSRQASDVPWSTAICWCKSKKSKPITDSDQAEGCRNNLSFWHGWKGNMKYLITLWKAKTRVLSSALYWSDWPRLSTEWPNSNLHISDSILYNLNLIVCGAHNRLTLTMAGLTRHIQFGGGLRGW